MLPGQLVTHHGLKHHHPPNSSNAPPATPFLLNLTCTQHLNHRRDINIHLIDNLHLLSRITITIIEVESIIISIPILPHHLILDLVEISLLRQTGIVAGIVILPRPHPKQVNLCPILPTF